MHSPISSIIFSVIKDAVVLSEMPQRVGVLLEESSGKPMRKTVAEVSCLWVFWCHCQSLPSPS